MNIFSKAALQSMKKSRTRTVVTVIGVALSAAMITAVATFSVSLLNYMVNGAIHKYGGWHIEFPDADSSFIQERTHDDGVAGVTTFENIGYANLAGGKNPDKPYLFLTGFDREAFETLPIHLMSGRLPENSSEILVPAHVAANGGVHYAVGDSLSLAVGDRVDGAQKLSQHDPYRFAVEAGTGSESLILRAEKTYTIVGIFERPVFEEFSAPGYTLITAADPADQADSFSLFITLTNPRQIRTYVKHAAGDHPYLFNDYVLRFMGVSNDRLFNALLYSVGGILIALVMTGSVFLIYNSFTISLNERTRQFGILSSVGATAKQLRNSVLFEGLCIGAAGIPIGVITGIASISLVISFVAGNFGTFAYSSVPLTLTISAPAIAAAVMISLITILPAAYIPARKAAGRPVMESIRQTNEVKIEARAVKTPKLVQQLFGLEGTLALKNFKRNRKRCRSIVLSLTLSVALFVSANAFGTCLKQGVNRSVMNTDYDICLYTQDMEESELFRLYDKLQEADGVEESSYQALMAYSCIVDTSDLSDSFREYAERELTDYQEYDGWERTASGKNIGQEQTDAPEHAEHRPTGKTVSLPMDLQFIEDNEFQRFIERLGLPITEYTGQDAKMVAVAKKKTDKTKDGQSGLVDLFTDRSLAVTVAPERDNKPVAKQEQAISITFVDTIPTDTLPRESAQVKPFVFMIVAPYNLKEKFEFSEVRTEMGLTFLSENPSKTVAEMEQILQKAGVTSAYTLYNVNKMFEENRSILFVVNVFTYVFVLMISLIAIANVFNTISTDIRLRRRELAMLRSVGMSERDFNKMMRFECAFYGMRTLLFGLPLAGALSWLIYKGMALGGADIRYVFPWVSMAVSVFGVFFAVFITMLYAVSRIKKENIIEALRDDMA